MANRRFIDFPIASTVGDSDIILIWQSGANKQTTKATFLSGLPENLEDLNDVVISGLTNGQILRYDSVTGKWENTDQGNLDLNDLNDVSIVSPSNGQVLVYNSSTSQWENSSGGYVPYVGAVTTVDLGAQGLRAGYVRFDTTVAGVPNEQGLMFWDADDETVDIILNGYTMKIGEDLFYPVKNQTGSTIAKGVAVRFNGTVGASGRLLIAPFIADGSVPSSRFMGVTAEEILNGEDGKVLYFGRVRGINTNAFNEGDILYASTTSAGGYQTAIPVAPNNIVQVAAVVTKSATVGTIFVRPTLGSNINTDEGVKITSVADKNLLQYQSGTALWENKSLAQVLGGTSSQFVKGDGSLDSTSYGTGTVTSVGLSSATSGVTIGSTPVTTSGTITLAIATASGSQNGLLSSTDWTTFNNKQNALTNPVTGTGSSGQVAYFNGTTSITSESNLFWDATNDRLGINTTPSYSLDVNGTGQFGNTSNNTNAIQFLDANTTKTHLGSAFGATFIQNNNYYNGSAYVFDDNTIGSANVTLSAGTINFQTGTANVNPSTKLTMFSNGNVFIGTSPSDNGARLQVSGLVAINSDSGGSALRLIGRAAADASAIRFFANNNSTQNARVESNSSEFEINSISNLPITFKTNDTTRLTIAASTGAATFSSSVSAAGITSTGTNTMLSASTSTAGLIVRGGSSVGAASFASGQILVGQTPTYRLSLAYDDNTGFAYIDNLYDNANSNIYFRVRTNGTPINALTLFGSGAATFSSSVRSNGVNAFMLSQTDNTTDTKTWSIQNLPTSGQFRIRALNDAETNGINAITISRTGISSVSLDFGGAATFSSNLTIKGNDLDLNNGSVLHRITNDNTNLLIRADYGNDSPNSTIQFSVDGNSPALTIASTGAATFSSSLTTGAPAGGTAQPWKLGTVATVSPTSPNRTIEVEVNGTTYYLHAKTTNN